MVNLNKINNKPYLMILNIVKNAIKALSPDIEVLVSKIKTPRLGAFEIFHEKKVNKA